MNISAYKEVQNIAKIVHEKLKETITPQSTERSIIREANSLLKKFGINDTWYHNVPALVLLGTNSCISISGKDYSPSDELVGNINLVTIDLSPKQDKIWGDCARSFVIENGKVTSCPKDPELAEGIVIEQKLHEAMIQFATPTTKFSQLYEFANDLIIQYGYENLDFLNNLGHSIEESLSDRRFIDSDCHVYLSQVPLFTFEPHIKKKHGIWGFKHEDIYYFDADGNILKL